MNINKKGFTIIELIVVIAIIAVLASITVSGVNKYIGKAKLARANADVTNIEKGLLMFKSQYGDYPYLPWGDEFWTQFYSSNLNIGGPGDPYLTVNGDRYLSEFYKSDWTGYNANFFKQNGFYYVELFDEDEDGKIGCGYIAIYDQDWNDYGRRYIICQDCDYCNDDHNVPFQTTPL